MMLAAFLSNGSFSFPHFGEYMHDGQPSLHSQLSISFRVFSHSGFMFE